MKREGSPSSGAGFWLASILLVFVGAGFLAAAPAPGRSLKQTQLTGFEHHVTPDRIRVVVRFDAAVQYVGGTATDPFRIYFDLQGTRPAAALVSRAEVGDSIVQRIRVAQYRPGITRMVLDMARPAPYTATFLANPPRLVIDVLRTGAGAELRNVKEAHNPDAPPSPLSSAQPRRDSHHAPAGKQAGLKPSTPEPPPAAALAPEQMPPLPPQVTYRNGLLTIVASNSTLSDVLHAVAVHTGATVDAPASLIGQRVAARLGPAPPRQVMADLLAGFDYIVVGASDDPNAIRNIILSPNSSSVLTPAPSGRSAPKAQVKTESPEEGEEPAESELSPQPAAQEQEPPTAGAGGQSAPVKTPEELLEELRKLQDEQSKEPGR